MHSTARALGMDRLVWCADDGLTLPEINEPARRDAILDPADYQKYIREFEAPPEHMLTA